MPKELTSITDKEINKILEISNILNRFLKDWKRYEKEEGKVTIELGNYFLREQNQEKIWKCSGKYLEITKKGIFIYQLPLCERMIINNPFKIAQYLINKGYVFN